MRSTRAVWRSSTPCWQGAGVEGHTVANITTREIGTQPAVWTAALAEAGAAATVFGRPGERVLLLGCGTSAFVAESIAALRETAGLGLTDAGYASEWRPGRTYDRVVVISRSGTTSEVISALALVDAGVTTALITAVHGSPAGDLVTEELVLDRADEESVVQTRFPTTVLAVARRIFGYDVADLARQ
ncbi:MAG: SIS domain-containing protein, partial [Cellulomonadaceae bacterium]|nr:SIS domain-containing protein [Cellulomonadaceae bacterium]